MILFSVAQPRNGSRSTRNLGPIPRATEVAEGAIQKYLHAIVFYYSISPSHQNTLVTTIKQESVMNSKNSTKLAALGMALMMNGFILGSIAYLFDAQVLQHPPVLAVAAA